MKTGLSDLESEAWLRHPREEAEALEDVGWRHPGGHWTDGSGLGQGVQSGQHCVLTEAVWVDDLSMICPRIANREGKEVCGQGSQGAHIYWGGEGGATRRKDRQQ